MSGFKDGGQVIVPVPLEFTGIRTLDRCLFPFIIFLLCISIGSHFPEKKHFLRKVGTISVENAI